MMMSMMMMMMMMMMNDVNDANYPTTLLHLLHFLLDLSLYQQSVWTCEETTKVSLYEDHRLTLALSAKMSTTAVLPLPKTGVGSDSARR
jgi:hypothetical protein